MNKEQAITMLLHYIDEFIEIPPFPIKRTTLKELSYSRTTANLILDKLMSPFTYDDGIEIIEDFIFEEELLFNLVRNPRHNFFNTVVLETAYDILNYMKGEKK